VPAPFASPLQPWQPNPQSRPFQPAPTRPSWPAQPCWWWGRSPRSTRSASRTCGCAWPPCWRCWQWPWRCSSPRSGAGS